MITINVNQSSGDIILQDGDLQLIDENEAIGADFIDRLRTIQGEWALDEAVGTAYINEGGIFDSTITQTEREFIIKAKILEDPDILEILDFTYDVTDNQLSVTTTVKTIYSTVTLAI